MKDTADPDHPHRLYFAYGSNLDEGQMRERCPASVVVGLATLPDHRLVFAGHSRTRGGPVASVLPAAGCSVRGLLYRCTNADIDELDCREGRAYERRILTVHGEDGRQVEAEVYVQRAAQPTLGDPPRAYLEIIRRAYRALGLDESSLPG